jgi:excisionase family DNA binding protein
MPNWITTAQAAERINRDSSYVRRAIAHGWLKAEKLGHDNLIEIKHLEKWIAQGCRVYPNKKAAKTPN